MIVIVNVVSAVIAGDQRMLVLAPQSIIIVENVKTEHCREAESTTAALLLAISAAFDWQSLFAAKDSAGHGPQV